MGLWLRALGGTLVCFTLGGAAIYLLVEVFDYLKEEIFAGSLPTILAVIYGALGGLIMIVSLRFTIAKSYREIMEIEIQRKERKKLEKERKKRESEIEEP